MLNKNEEVEVSELPKCDICRQYSIIQPAQYDSRLKNGVWANVCKSHFRKFGTGLGLGRGQKFILIK